MLKLCIASLWLLKNFDLKADENNASALDNTIERLPELDNPLVVQLSFFNSTHHENRCAKVCGTGWGMKKAVRKILRLIRCYG